jgi:hypothetical protein
VNFQRYQYFPGFSGSWFLGDIHYIGQYLVKPVKIGVRVWVDPVRQSVLRPAETRRLICELVK